MLITKLLDGTERTFLCISQLSASILLLLPFLFFALLASENFIYYLHTFLPHDMLQSTPLYRVLVFHGKLMALYKICNKNPAFYGFDFLLHSSSSLSPFLSLHNLLEGLCVYKKLRKLSLSFFREKSIAARFTAHLFSLDLLRYVFSTAEKIQHDLGVWSVV